MEVIQGVELVRTDLNGVMKPWVVFVESMVAHEHILHGMVFWTISFRRRPGDGMYKGVHLTVRKMRRMWH